MTASIIHENAARHVAEEGAFSAASSTLPLLQYYPTRGRAEPIRHGGILRRRAGSRACTRRAQRPLPHPSTLSSAAPCRLALAYKRQAWYEPPVEPIQAIKRVQLDGYTFRQLPRFVDEVHGGIDLVQSMVGGAVRGGC